MATKKKVRAAKARKTTRAPSMRAKSTLAVATESDVQLPYSVVYIHGIGRQDPPIVAKQNWDTALFGHSMADTAMAYWSDIRYPTAANVGAKALARTERALAREDAKAFMAKLSEKNDAEHGRCRKRGERPDQCESLHDLSGHR